MKGPLDVHKHTHTLSPTVFVCMTKQLRYIHPIKRDKEDKEQHKTKDLACRSRTLLHSARLFTQITLALKTCISSTESAHLCPEVSRLMSAMSISYWLRAAKDRGIFSLERWHSLYISLLYLQMNCVTQLTFVETLLMNITSQI